MEHASPCTAEVFSDWLPTPWKSQDGSAIRLEMVGYRPAGPGPFPTVVINHGSTGGGTDPALFARTWTSPELADFFVERGWQAFFPQRRGRGRSGGVYEEGLDADRSRYSCQPDLAMAGFAHAMADLDVVMAHVRRRPDVQAHRLLLAGVSRGGMLSIVHAATHPGWIRGAVNFVGGWLGEGCSSAQTVNRTLCAQGGGFPRDTLWIYARDDRFYSLQHSRANFDAFVAAGGRGRLVALTPAAGAPGHEIHKRSDLWGGIVHGYLAAIAKDSGHDR